MDECTVANGARSVGWATSEGQHRSRRVAVATAQAGLLAAIVLASLAGPRPASVSSDQVAGGMQLSTLARLAISRGLGAEDRGYWATRAGGALSADNARQRLAIDFAAAGTTVATTLGRARLSLESARGDGRSLALAGARPAALTNRVSYDRGPITEWYANGPAGLEQGFTVSRAVAPTARHTLALSVALRLSKGWRARVSAGAVELLAGSRIALRYGGLHVVDARGRDLPAWMTLGGASITLHVRTAGARFPLVVDPIVQQGTLLAAPGFAGDGLGQAVAVSGSLVAVGAPGVTVGGQQGAGAVYVFSEPSGGWASADGAVEMTASSPQAGAGLGGSVAISGDTILAGAPNATVGNLTPGTVLLFNEPASGWASEHESGQLTEPSPTNFDGFGTSLAASGSTVAVGAPLVASLSGAVDVYTEPASGWATEGPAGRLTMTGGGIGALGSSVAIDGSTIVAGAPFADTLAGQLVVYGEPSGGWTSETQTALLTRSSGSAGDTLGQSVGISGSTIVGGAPGVTVGANPGQGAAYVYTQSSSGWANATETQALTASGGAAGDELGAAVAISGSTILAAAPAAAADEGAAYAFGEGQGGWSQSGVLTETAGAAGDAFGTSLAVSGPTLAVGAPAASGNHGAVVVFGGVPIPPPVVTGATTTSATTTTTTSTSTLSTTTTTAPLPVGPPVRSAVPPRHYATVTAVGGGPGYATVSLACAATTGKCTAANVALQVRETLAGSRVLAVQAKAHSALVVIGDGHVTLSARAHTTLVVHLNGAGLALLKSRAQLATGLSVGSTGRVLRLATVTITRPARRR